MPFKPGKSPNPSGRPRGSKNKAGKELREKIGAFLDGRFQSLERDWRKMSPTDRRKLYVELLPYHLPKLSASDLNIQFESLSDKDLDNLYEKVISKINFHDEEPNASI
jgi:hypothetical protein